MQKCILYVPKLEVKGCKMHPYILVMPHFRATEQTSTICADIGRQKPTLRKIKRAVLPPHKPTQKQHI
jgi:hypothetical protein